MLTGELKYSELIKQSFLRNRIEQIVTFSAEWQDIEHQEDDPKMVIADRTQASFPLLNTTLGRETRQQRLAMCILLFNKIDSIRG